MIDNGKHWNAYTVLFHSEMNAAMLDELVILNERAGIQKSQQTLTRSEFALKNSK